MNAVRLYAYTLIAIIYFVIADNDCNAIRWRHVFQNQCNTFKSEHMLNSCNVKFNRLITDMKLNY